MRVITLRVAFSGVAACNLDLPVLSDGVICLRPFAVTDAPALVEIWKDPTIRARNTVPEPSQDGALRWIVGHAAAAAAGQAWEWALVDAATERLAGRRVLKAIDWKHGRATAGAWVAPGFRGRQFAPRSLRLAAAHAFARGLVRVETKCEADNVTSIRSVRSAGMRHEGTLRSYFVSNADERVDAEVFGLLPDDLTNAPAFRLYGVSGAQAPLCSAGGSVSRAGRVPERVRRAVMSEHLLSPVQKAGQFGCDSCPGRPRPVSDDSAAVGRVARPHPKRGSVG